MKFKNIRNQTLVNIKNCEDEPIHIPGSIQPHGFLFGLNIRSLIIEYCSDNLSAITGLHYRQCLGKGIEVFLGENQTNKLTRYITSITGSSTKNLKIKFTDKYFDCTIHNADTILIMEFELCGTNKMSVSDIYDQTKRIISSLQQAGSMQILSQLVADETRKVTGYDRVMIYKFDTDYNGEVFAESKIDSMETWLNLHYPHTDIPAQARALFLKNGLRIIPDVNYTPASIFTIDDSSEDKNLDLSLSVLRSSSPIHIQYLKNMGVAASLTVSLLYNGKLWGMIACHHNSPKYLTNNTRMIAELQGQFLSSQIRVRELAEEYDVTLKVDAALNNLISLVFSNDMLAIENFINESDLLLIANAASVIVIMNEMLYVHGMVPEQDEIRKLANWLHIYSPASGISISNLSALYPDAKKWSNMISGVLYFALGSGQNNCILWCRPEVVQEVLWAGNPNESVVKSEKSLSPRHSFESWKEVKRYESNGWLQPEFIAATNFVNAFQKHVHMLFLADEELKQRTLKEKFKRADTELENLYWIGSHDLKEPLRKIQMVASRITNEDYSGDFQTIVSNVKRMNDSAKRMQLLVSDILAYSALSHVKDALKNVDFNEILQNVITELAVEINQQDATIRHNTLPKIKGITFLLQQLLINLIRNSLKFSKAAASAKISITYNGEMKFPLEEGAPKLYHNISIRDNGIGFDKQFNTSVFNVFTRLHNQKEYAGSGVGLALCNKIMKNHNGFITAEGKPGIGTVISLFFPVFSD